MHEIDPARFPLVVVEIRDPFTVEDADGIFGYMAEQIAREQKFAMALRPHELSVPPVSTLKYMASWIGNNREGVAAFNVCISIHLASAALRGALKFMNTLATPASPQESFATWEETLAWATDMLAEAGLEPGG